MATSSGMANVVSGVGESRHLRSIIILTLIQPATARETTAVSSARGVSTLQATPTTTSSSLLLSSLEVVATAEIPKHGEFQLGVRTIVQRRVRARPRRFSPATSPISPTHSKVGSSCSGGTPGNDAQDGGLRPRFHLGHA